MSTESFRLPDNSVTTDKTKYADAWSQLGEAIARILPDSHIIGFDPGVLVKVGNSTIDFPTSVVVQLVALETERNQLKETLSRINGIGADGLMDGLDYGDYLAAVKARDEAREMLKETLWVLSVSLAEHRGETCLDCGKEWGACAESECENGNWFRAGLTVLKKTGWEPEQ